jgi:hypothetical protein
MKPLKDLHDGWKANKATKNLANDSTTPSTASFKWTGKDFNTVAKNTTPNELIRNLEQLGWTKTVEPGGGRYGPATTLTDPVTGTKVRIMTSPLDGNPYFRVQSRGNNYLGSDGLFPSNATRQELRELTHFYFQK